MPWARGRAWPINRPHFLALGAGAGALLLLACSGAIAWPGYGEEVDAFCAGYDGSTPFADLGGGGDGCLLCHRDRSGSGAQPGTWDWWRNRTFELYCTGTPPNRAPDGHITAPLADQRISAGSTLRFEGTGSDPDGDALTLSWDFGVGTATGPGPHVVTYPSAGTFTVLLTVADGDLTDPTPARRRIEVTAATGCTDADGDGWLAGDASCAPIDCDDGDPSVNPGAVEDCADGLDNDCNGLIDGADPAAVACAGCLDADGDRFSPEGDLCGPIDCDDTDPTVNPGAVEDCTDGRDNDCDFYLDDTDPDCSGDDCRGRLLPDPGLGVLVATDPGAAEPLDGLVVSGPIQVFVADRDGIELVRWFVDGELVDSDGTAPWTLGADDEDTGAGGVSGFLDTRELANGWHGITADVTLSEGRQQRFTAAVLVDNPDRPGGDDDDQSDDDWDRGGDDEEGDERDRDDDEGDDDERDDGRDRDDEEDRDRDDDDGGPERDRDDDRERSRGRDRDD